MQRGCCGSDAYEHHLKQSQPGLDKGGGEGEEGKITERSILKLSLVLA